MTRKRLSETRIKDILAHFDHRCYIDKCRKPLGERSSFHLDHAVPYALGGACDESNLYPICKSCHDEKTNKFHTGDKTLISRAKKLAVSAIGYKKPKQKIPSRGFYQQSEPRVRQLDDEMGGWKP
jgi:5-methylcytosine-specific restriction endonuclease McrA